MWTREADERRDAVLGDGMLHKQNQCLRFVSIADAMRQGVIDRIEQESRPTGV
jgi:hypothetical protein